MVTRRRRNAKHATPTLTVHQIVAYNFTRARQAVRWTQVETSDRLEPYLGYRLNQAGISAIEKTYDTERRRNIDTAEVVAFARCFGVPIGWFFLPPTGHAGDLIEPVDHDDRHQLPAAELLPLAVGTPSGWSSYLQRLSELLHTDRQAVASALAYALDGCHDPDDLQGQLNLRRRAIQAITLARHATPTDDVIQQMAQLLVQLVNLTPIGLNRLRELDPDQALALLAEGDQHLQPHLMAAEARRRDGRPSAGDFDDAQPIDIRRMLAQADEREVE